MSAFEDRGMDMRPRVNLTMAAYAEAPMLPSRPTNEMQREVVKKAAMVLPLTRPEQRTFGRPAKIDKRIGKAPAKPFNGKLPPEQEEKRKSGISAAHLGRSESIARKVLADGPRSSEEIAKELGHKDSRVTGAFLRRLAERGIVKRAGWRDRIAMWGLA